MRAALRHVVVFAFVLGLGLGVGAFAKAIAGSALEQPSTGGGSSVGGGPVAAIASTDQSTYTVIGGSSFDATGHSQIKLYATGYVTDANCTLTVLLRDDTGASDVTTVTTSSISAVLMQSAALSLTAAARIYTIQIKLTGGSCGLGQTGTVYSAGISFD